mmetsp:Transcript_16986/g.48340  ORF Transcript_16986/g.48340 Transcript_16986/m.48340 type:complete len:247 (-) Transcript_16986:385-1125(-)
MVHEVVAHVLESLPDHRLHHVEVRRLDEDVAQPHEALGHHIVDLGVAEQRPERAIVAVLEVALGLRRRLARRRRLDLRRLLRRRLWWRLRRRLRRHFRREMPPAEIAVVAGAQHVDALQAESQRLRQRAHQGGVALVGAQVDVVEEFLDRELQLLVPAALQLRRAQLHDVQQDPALLQDAAEQGAALGLLVDRRRQRGGGPARPHLRDVVGREGRPPVVLGRDPEPAHRLRDNLAGQRPDELQLRL